MKEKLLKLFQQFIKFGLVGVSNTIISLGFYYLLVFFNFHPVIANAVGFLASVINSYFWNSKFVFKEKTEKNNKKAFLKVFVSYGLSFLLSTVLIEVFVDVLHISKYVAPILRLVFTIPLNFFMNKIWAFKEKMK